MLPAIQERHVYVRPGPTDMRKQINGLSVMVQETLGQNPFDGAYFMFCNRQRKLLKILYWEDTGFCLWIKRLEKDRFPWPRSEESVKKITTRELQMLLGGIDFWNAHRKVEYTSVY